MRTVLKYLRLKSSKPIPKKGSPEYLDLQKRLTERKIQSQTPSPLIPSESTPRFFKYSLICTAVPSSLGLLCMLSSEPFSPLYTSSFALTGSWIGASTVLLCGSHCGLEAFAYRLPQYLAPKNYMFTGSRRVFFSLSSIPFGLLCVHSTVFYDWIGFSLYFLYLLANTLATIRGGEQGLTPGWLASAHWPWLVHTQLVLMFLIYSVMSMKANAKEIVN
jgi:hypothetical protein